MLSRIFHGENENAALKRKRQIDTLKIFNDNVIELQEGVEYQVQFDAGDKRMAIMVSLSPEFPLEKPVLRVTPQIVHPWCNEHSEIISAPGLLNFTVHSDLGRVVQAIIREFSKNPPAFLEDVAGKASPSYSLKSPFDLATPYTSYYNASLLPFSSSNATTGVYNYNFANSSINNYSSVDQLPKHFNAALATPFMSPYISPDINNPQIDQYSSLRFTGPQIENQVQVNTKQQHSKEFPELINLSTDELQKLVNDDDRLDEFLEKHPRLKDLDTAVEEAIDLVEKTATINLSKDEEIQEIKKDINDKIETFNSLKCGYDELVDKYSEVTKIFKPDNIRNCLKESADQVQEQSEKIAEDFLNRKIDVERFISTYIECRKLGQARRTKEEKLAHQLNELKRTNSN